VDVFPPPLTPSELVDDRYPALKHFLQVQVDMQVADLRVLLQLPIPALDPNAAGNLTTTAALLNLISGFSVWLYQTQESLAIRALEERTGGRQSRRRFMGFVTNYWPRVPPEPEPAQVAERLYQTRNSLVHDLGATDDPSRTEPRSITIGKVAGLTLDDVVTRFERNLAHPLTVPVIQERGETFALSVDGLYWAAHWMLRETIRDQAAAINRAIADQSFADIRVDGT
jgi:hypothetical protein